MLEASVYFPVKVSVSVVSEEPSQTLCKWIVLKHSEGKIVPRCLLHLAPHSAMAAIAACMLLPECKQMSR